MEAELFTELPWADTKPQPNPATIDVYKGRQKLESLKIDCGVFSFGRLPECSMHLEHGSISRRHAALAYDEDSTLYLVDLGSAHGTFVDDKIIRPNKRTKVGSSNVIKFGASTRTFRLVLPPPKEETAEQWAIRKAKEVDSAAKLKALTSSSASASSSSSKRKQETDGDDTTDNDKTDSKRNNDSDNDSDKDDDAEKQPLVQKSEEQKAKEKAERKQNKKDSKKAYWKELKDQQRAAKRRKRTYFPKKQSENDRLDSICGQPTW